MDDTLQDRVESKLARVAELNAQKDAMSDTTGWDCWAEGRYRKTIGDYHFECNRMSPRRWYLRAGSQNVKPARPTLRKCQILAHDTARLWAGESE